MKTLTTNSLISLLHISVFALAASVTQADFIEGNVNFTTSKDTYLGGVSISNWNFSRVKEHTGGGNNSINPDGTKGAWTQWEFDVEHEDGRTTSGVIYSVDFNGNGAGGEGTGNAGVLENGTATMSHNSANNFTVSFIDAFVDSFYISLVPWSSYNAAATFNLTVQYWDVEGTLQTIVKQQQFSNDSPFLGFVLDEGTFLQSVKFDSTGTGNNGYMIGGMGFGATPDYIPPSPDPTPGTTPTPEPAAMLIFGIGAAGMGAIALRRKLRKK
ncbi:MAG: PEP-CTERM sorting domain-containing protein [Planctomycetaceae bacterium]|nr:PEP-CTERM sorting domain-containing protein [Planctomycetaceae bacterium]